MRIPWIAFAILSMACIAATVLTAARAERLTGDSYGLFTKTRVLVEVETEADNPTDAALDELFAEVGEPATITELRPIFVFGLLDAALPVTAVGGLTLAAVHRFRRRRSTRAADEHETAD